jgi:hypothetical protein
MTAAGKCAGLWLEISGPPKRGGDSVAQRDLMCDASCAGPTARRVVPAGKSPARAGARGSAALRGHLASGGDAGGWRDAAAARDFCPHGTGCARSEVVPIRLQFCELVHSRRKNLAACDLIARASA